MFSLIWTLLFVAMLVGIAYKRTKLNVAVIAMAVFTLITLVFAAPGAIFWLSLVVTAVLAVLNTRGFRANTITKPIFELYKKIMPDMSETEATALDAGTVWWDGELFSGKPDWHKLTSHPNPTLRPDEQAFMDNQLNTLCSMVDEWEISQNADMEKEIWDYIRKERFFSMIIPKSYGGLEFSALAQTHVLKRISMSGAVFSTVGVPNSLGPGELLLKYGTEEQKNYYLPRLADGREIPCFGLTGPRAGSDATSLPDTGIICKGEYEGKEVLGIKLNFSKRYITLAPVATVVGLAFRLFDPEKLAGEKTDLGITVALLPRHLKGMEIGSRHLPIGSPFMNGPIFGKDVFIPLDFIIGGKEMAGQGWKMLVECLSVGRCITLPSSGAGGGKYGVAAAGAYSRIRRQFNIPIMKLEGVQEPLARTAAHSYIAEAASRVTAIAIDQGEKPAVPAAILKYNLTDLGRQMAIDCMDIHAGKAVIRGPKNKIESSYSSVPVAITVEGANILTRTFMTFGQGAIRCHPQVLNEMNAAKSNDLKAFDKALFTHFGLVFSNMARSFVLGLTNAAFTSVPVSGPTKKYYKQLNRYVASFGLMVDMSMFSLGGELKFRELISARLADMLSSMYLASMVLKHWEDQGRHKEDLPIVEYAMRLLFSKYEESQVGVINNLPARPVAWLLKVLTMPFGRSINKPGDKLGAKVVGLVTALTPTRERLISGCYMGEAKNGENPLVTYERLLKGADRAEGIYKKISDGLKEGKYDEATLTVEGRIEEGVKLGILSKEDGEFMLDFEKDVLDMVNVDHFPLEHFGQVAVKHKAPAKRASKSTKTDAEPA